MKIFKFSLFLIFLVLSTILVSAYNSWNYYLSSPSDLLENEWVIFGGIFLLVFAVVFVSLSNVFKRERKNVTFPWIKDVEQNIGATIVISLVIALFTAAALVRRAMIADYLGEAATLWITVIVLIVMLVLLAPFYKGLKANWGSGVALGITLFVIWLALRALDPYYFLPSTVYSPDFEEIYEALRSYAALVVIVVISVIAGLMKRR